MRCRMAHDIPSNHLRDGCPSGDGTARTGAERQNGEGASEKLRHAGRRAAPTKCGSGAAKAVRVIRRSLRSLRSALVRCDGCCLPAGRVSQGMGARGQPQNRANAFAGGAEGDGAGLGSGRRLGGRQRLVIVAEGCFHEDAGPRRHAYLRAQRGVMSLNRYPSLTSRSADCSTASGRRDNGRAGSEYHASARPRAPLGATGS